MYEIVDKYRELGWRVSVNMHKQAVFVKGINFFTLNGVNDYEREYIMRK